MNNQTLDLAKCVYNIVQPCSKGKLSYGDVCNQLAGRWANLEPNSALLAEALCIIVTRCRDANLPALSAVVVHKTGDNMPGTGYFTAAHPGITDPLKRRIAWAEELVEVNDEKNYPSSLDEVLCIEL